MALTHSHEGAKKEWRKHGRVGLLNISYEIIFHEILDPHVIKIIDIQTNRIDAEIVWNLEFHSDKFSEYDSL